MMNRRDFLFRMSAALPLMSHRAWLPFLGDDDEVLCRKRFDMAVSKRLAQRNINDVIVAMGQSFLGTEYLAHALEVPGEERLVVNLRGLDCVSFYENALVFARCIKMQKTTFDDYKAQLQFIRYRGGVIDGYLSRLHYTTDYIYDNVQKGVWKDVTEEIGGVPYEKKVNFMSTHPDSYRQLKEHPELVEGIRKIEEEINGRKKFYIPKENVKKLEQKLESGDIVGITTSIEGLDTSHTGILVRQSGELWFMHAPSPGKLVQLTDVPIWNYLKRNTQQTGIIVARALEP